MKAMKKILKKQKACIFSANQIMLIKDIYSKPKKMKRHAMKVNLYGGYLVLLLIQPFTIVTGWIR